MRVIEPWTGWSPLCLAWKIGLVVVTCAGPLLASDFCVMLPCTMVYLVAGGLLQGYARLKPACGVCMLELDPGRGGATRIEARSPFRRFGPASIPPSWYLQRRCFASFARQRSSSSS